MSKFKETEDLLRNYKKLIGEIENLKIDMEEVKKEYQGCKGLLYEEKVGFTNSFNSIVENEIIAREKEIEKLKLELHEKQLIVKKIENALISIRDRERDYKIIEMKYFRRLGWCVIAEHFELTEDRLMQIKRKIIKELSEIIFVGDRL